MNVYQPLRRSLVAVGVTIAVLVGAQAMAQIGDHPEYPSALPTIASVSVAPNCVADASAQRTTCYQANVIVGEPEPLK